MAIASQYVLNFDPLRPYLHAFVQGVVTTLTLSLLTIALSFALAIPGVLLRISPHIVVRGMTRAYVDVVRNMPTLVILYVIYFGMSNVVNLSSFTSAVIALTISGLAFAIEAYRGGIQGVPKGQIEAANAMGLHRWAMWRWVVLPQAIRVAFPALGNLVISMVLSTALVLVVGAKDVTYQANIAGSATFRYFEAFIVAGVIYLVLAQVISLLWKLLGRILFPDYSV
jgi:His/Glu/Gln/Arg/opine family amino acid ABC transporter permease subunit